MDKGKKKPSKLRTPRMSFHKGNGQYRVRLNGRSIYLGTDPVEADNRYHRVISEWIGRGRKPKVDPDEITIVEILARFKTEYVEQHFDNRRSKENLLHLLETLKASYGSFPAVSFGPQSLKSLQRGLVAQEFSRSWCNRTVFAIRRLFRWAVSEELVPPSVIQGLNAVETLRKGHTTAKDSRARRPVSDVDFFALEKYVTPTVWTILQLLRLTGARPSELLQLRPGDIDRSAATWCARLSEHKTAHHGKDRVLWFGKDARALLVPVLLRKRDGEYLFSPKDAVSEKAAPLDKRRREGQPETPRETDRTLGVFYLPAALCRCVARAVDKANADTDRKDLPKVRKWTPYELRHTAATRARAAAGLDGAQTLLGHANADVTQVYAQIADEKGRQIAELIG